MAESNNTLNFKPKSEDSKPDYGQLLANLGQAVGDDATTPDQSPDRQLGLCAQLARSENADALHLQLQHIVRSLGFSDYSFVRMNCTNNNIPLITNPKDQLSAYFDEGFHKHDFVVRYAVENTRPIFLSKVYGVAYDAPYDIEVFRANQRIYELNQKFGYLDYYCVPMKACNGGRNVMLTVAQRGVRSVDFQVNVARHKPFLRVLCEAIDYVTTTKFPEDFLDKDESKAIKINPKPLLVLSTLANNDMTMAAVAEKLCISTITANQHLAAVRRELEVRTTVGAIKKAIKLGLIKYT